MSEADPSVDADTWHAIQDRDARADGAFVYAVRSTGIYCRPTCPSKRPYRDGVRTFASADEAEDAGYRACERCRPNEVSRHQRVVARIQHLLESVEPTPTLADLARDVGLTSGHVQRIFSQRTGVSPRQYATALKAERLQALLRAGEDVASAGYDAGYGSAHALHGTATDALGMTPGRYRRGGAGETIRYGFASTAHGRILLAATERGVCALRFGSDEDTTTELSAEFPRATLQRDDARVSPLLQTVQEHLARLHDQLLLPLDVEASAFQREVWLALREIPIGETRSYKQVAEALGRPTASRAVARACAANPVAVVVPCHRIVRASVGLAGYRWGVERKRTLLDAEAEAARNGPARDA